MSVTGSKNWSRRVKGIPISDILLSSDVSTLYGNSEKPQCNGIQNRVTLRQLLNFQLRTAPTKIASTSCNHAKNSSNPSPKRRLCRLETPTTTKTSSQKPPTLRSGRGGGGTQRHPRQYSTRRES